MHARAPHPRPMPRRARAASAPGAALLALLAAAPLLLARLPSAAADAFPCSGRVAVSSACGAVFASAAGPGSLVPTNKCAPCRTAGCSCPPSDCVTVVSSCREVKSNLAVVKVGFGGCKYARTDVGGRDTRIEWVAFQGVDAAGKTHRNYGWIKNSANTLPDTSKCANTAAGNSSTCCLQLNVQGNGQINAFKVQCGTRPVIWMGDATFNSCNSDAEEGPVTLPGYVFGGADTGKNFCGAPDNDPAAQVCGPYTLPAADCATLPKC